MFRHWSNLLYIRSCTQQGEQKPEAEIGNYLDWQWGSKAGQAATRSETLWGCNSFSRNGSGLHSHQKPARATAAMAFPRGSSRCASARRWRGLWSPLNTWATGHLRSSWRRQKRSSGSGMRGPWGSPVMLRCLRASCGWWAGKRRQFATVLQNLGSCADDEFLFQHFLFFHSWLVLGVPRRDGDTRGLNKGFTFFLCKDVKMKDLRQGDWVKVSFPRIRFPPFFVLLTFLLIAQKLNNVLAGYFWTLGLMYLCLNEVNATSGFPIYIHTRDASLLNTLQSWVGNSHLSFCPP